MRATPGATSALTRRILAALALCLLTPAGLAHAQTSPDEAQADASPDEPRPQEETQAQETQAQDTQAAEPVYDISDDDVEGEPVEPEAPSPAQTPLVVPAQAQTPDPEQADVFRRSQRIGDIESTFIFGSYARVRAATDLNGQTARPVNVVTHGSRIDELSYGELEFAQRFVVPHSASKFYFQTVATLAFADDFFHFTGKFDQTMAMRNLYADGGWSMNNDMQLGFWVGSRMYRGDDIYLLDFWPMDNLNTVGGGAYAIHNQRGFGRTELKLHAGANRLLNDFQFQAVDVPGLQFGSEEIVYLDRQRFIATARLQQDLWLDTRADGSPRTGLKLVLYGEDHSLDEGRRRTPDGLGSEPIPAESGYKLGAQVGYWIGDGYFDRTFVNLFLTHGSGLAAYGEFGVPSGINLNKTSEGASTTMVALSSALETPYLGALFGAYYKYFQDADRDSVDFDDYWEAIFTTRIHGYVTDHVHPGVELSYQLRRPQGPFAGTNRYEVPTVTKLSFIQALTLDRYMYSRPQLRFIYSLAMLNDSAKALYRPEDARSQMDYQQYLGVSVEWWFNNASLFRP